MRARDIAEALARKRLPEKSAYVAPCPCHDDQHPSLSLRDSENGILVHCFTGCDPLDVLAALRRRGLLETSRGLGRREPARPRRKAADEADTLVYVERLWREARSIIDTPGQRYLAQRRIDVTQLPDNGGLRWHPGCPWGERNTTGCIVARYSDARTGELRGLWRRPLTGEKPKSLGPQKGCVIRLWPDDEVTTGLSIGEGVETAASAALNIEHKGTLLQPAWATGCADNLANFPVLDVEALTILVDNDRTGRGQEAAASCARRWRNAGREVFRLTPKMLGFDFNDLIFRRGAA